MTTNKPCKLYAIRPYACRVEVVPSVDDPTMGVYFVTIFARDLDEANWLADAFEDSHDDVLHATVEGLLRGYLEVEVGDVVDAVSH